MLKTTKLLTITVPKAIYREIQGQAKKRKTTISGLMRTAFISFTQQDDTLYSDREIADLLKRDKISPKLQLELDSLLAS